MPRVFERRDLRFGIGARFVAEQYVVIAVAVKRRIKIDEIDRFILDIVTGDLQIVAVVKSIHRDMHEKFSVRCLFSRDHEP